MRGQNRSVLISAVLGLLVGSGGLASAQPLQATVHTESPPETGQITCCDVSSSLGRFTFVVPRGWKAKVETGASRLRLTSSDFMAEIEIGFLQEPNSSSEPVSTNSVRRQVLARFPRAAITAELPCYTAFATGAGCDFVWELSKGVRAAGRLVFISCPGGRLEFLLTSAPGNLAGCQPVMSGLLTSFARAAGSPTAAGLVPVEVESATPERRLAADRRTGEMGAPMDRSVPDPVERGPAAGATPKRTEPDAVAEAAQTARPSRPLPTADGSDQRVEIIMLVGLVLLLIVRRYNDQITAFVVESLDPRSRSVGPRRARSAWGEPEETAPRMRESSAVQKEAARPAKEVLLLPKMPSPAGGSPGAGRDSAEPVAWSSDVEGATQFLRRMSTTPTAEIPTAPSGDGPEPSNDPLQNFFAGVPQRLAALRQGLEELRQPTDEKAPQEVLVNLYQQVYSFTHQTGREQLRPVSQMGSALEGLLKRLFENPANLTPSILNTLNNAVDVLEALCVPGLKPDLATNPPVRLLVVDDNAAARQAVGCALQLAFDRPDSPETGEAALALAREKPYDVIFADVRMPGMDGFTLCARIHETVLNQQTPVVFVTGLSDGEVHTNAAQSGGSDFIAKPFLPVEITVKALTLALQRRLLAFSPEAGKTTDEDVLTQAPGAAAEFLASVPEHVASLRNVLHELGQEEQEEGRRGLLRDLQDRVAALSQQARFAGLAPVCQLLSASENLLLKLVQDPDQANASIVNTLSHALDLLEGLCGPDFDPNLALDPPPRILVADEDPVARQTVCCALQPVCDEPDRASNSQDALVLAGEQLYDVIFTAVQMPDMDGFTLCSLIHETTPNDRTPVVFVTCHSDEESRAQAARCGGADLIAKPFLLSEIAVKALTLTLQSRMAAKQQAA
jgi:CheY-like chemotaxis protein